MSGGIDIPVEIAAAINNTNISIDAIRAKLGEFLTKGRPLKELSAEFPQIEKAKLNIVIVYVLSSLYFIYLKSCGRELEGHPIFKELERVELYMKKIKKIEEKSIPDRNVFKVDQKAARKLIQRGIGTYKNEEEEEGGGGGYEMDTETNNSNDNKRKITGETTDTTVTKKKIKQGN